jgi:hypothetical protein
VVKEEEQSIIRGLEAGLGGRMGGHNSFPRAAALKQANRRVAQQASIRRSNLSQIRTRGLTRIKRLF